MSDSSNSHAYKIKLLDGATSYPSWAIKMMDILTDQELDIYVTGSKRDKPADTAKREDKEAWERGTRKALSSIRLRVGEGPMAYIRRATNAKEAWEKLQSIYQPKGAISIIHIRRKLFRAQCDEGDDIEAHIRALTNLRDKLASYGQTIEEAEFSVCILTSLPDSWDNWVSGIEINKITDSADIVSRIIQQDQRQKAKPNSDETALTAYQKRQQSRSSRSINDATEGCYHCGRLGHFSSECRDKAAGKSYTEKEKKDNYTRTKHFKGKKGGKSKANVAKDEAPNSEDDDFALAVQVARKSLTKDSWLLDSAASTHIINNKSLFHQYHETPGHTVKGLGSASGMGRGVVKISSRIGTTISNITLQDALYVPAAPHNLICLGKIHRTGCKLQFPINKLDVNVIAPNGRKILYGRNIGDVYALGNISPILPSTRLR